MPAGPEESLRDGAANPARPPGDQRAARCSLQGRRSVMTGHLERERTDVLDIADNKISFP
jgi:hypothetical protein